MSASIPSRFPLEQDYDVYCYLKAHLPPSFSIESSPSTAYYSEWSFRYSVTRGDEVLTTFEGDFREITPGSLVQQAKALLVELGVEIVDVNR